MAVLHAIKTTDHKKHAPFLGKMENKMIVSIVWQFLLNIRSGVLIAMSLLFIGWVCKILQSPHCAPKTKMLSCMWILLSIFIPICCNHAFFMAIGNVCLFCFLYSLEQRNCIHCNEYDAIKKNRFAHRCREKQEELCLCNLLEVDCIGSTLVIAACVQAMLVSNTWEMDTIVVDKMLFFRIAWQLLSRILWTCIPLCIAYNMSLAVLENNAAQMEPTSILTWDENHWVHGSFLFASIIMTLFNTSFKTQVYVFFVCIVILVLPMLFHVASACTIRRDGLVGRLLDQINLLMMSLPLVIVIHDSW